MKFLGCNVSAGKWKETIEEQNIDYNNFQINFYKQIYNLGMAEQEYKQQR